MNLPKIITAEQMKMADRFTMKELPIDPIDLMEKASLAFVEAILPSIQKNERIFVFCGCGNNGGDGLAVSRILKSKGYQVKPFLVKFKDALSDDCQINFDRITDTGLIYEGDEFPDLSICDIIIDALFGYGFKGTIEGWLQKFIEYINNGNKRVFSIDIPSGLESERIGQANIIKANSTISFQRPKLSFFLPENGAYVGNWSTVDIGLNKAFIQSQEGHFYLLDNSIEKLVKKRKRQSHKGSYGHALMVAGSFGKMGAAVLTTKAALRSGAGLVTAHIPKCGYNILQITVPEAMCSVDPEEHILTKEIDLDQFKAIGIGPGLGTEQPTADLLQAILEKAKVPMVIDADAINLISSHPTLYERIPKNCVFTPHIKEFDRLTGPSANSLERFDKQRNFAIKHQCVVVLKDAYTCVALPNGDQYFNTTGNPGMATGGSGDVLTGIITGLLAQSYTIEEAALLGVYFHGKAGNTAANLKGEYALIASDMIENLKID